MTISGQAESNAAVALPSIVGGDVSVFDVPLQEATPESLAEFGRLETSFESAAVEIVTWPTPGWRPIDAGTGTGGGVTSGAFEYWREGDVFRARNLAVDGDYIIGWFSDPAHASNDSATPDLSRVLVCEANYHPDSSQTFFPQDTGPFVALLAKPGENIRPENFIAFFFDGRFGLTIKPGVWHQPMFPLKSPAVFDGKQGRVHACISCNFVEEFGCYLSVPLRRSE